MARAAALQADDDADDGRLVQHRRDAAAAGHPVGARDRARDRRGRAQGSAQQLLSLRRKLSHDQCLAADKIIRHKGPWSGFGHFWRWQPQHRCLSAAPSFAASAEAPFEQPLMRLAEVLGSLHYLRNLCGETGNQWRDEMEQLLASENPAAGAAGALRRQLQPRLPLLRRRLRRLHAPRRPRRSAAT